MVMFQLSGFDCGSSGAYCMRLAYYRRTEHPRRGLRKSTLSEARFVCKGCPEAPMQFLFGYDLLCS